MTLLDLLKLMRKHLRLMIILPIICALATAGVSWFLLADEYTATVSMYVLTKSSESSDGISNTDLSASQMLTNDVAKLIKGSRVQGETADAMRIDDLSIYDIEVSSETSTRVINISVTGNSAQEVAIVANALAKTTDEVATSVMDLQSVTIIDEAKQPEAPSGPPRVMYTAVAFLAGIFLALAIIVVMDILDTRVRNPEEIEELTDLPVIGYMPVIKG